MTSAATTIAIAIGVRSDPVVDTGGSATGAFDAGDATIGAAEVVAEGGPVGDVAAALADGPGPGVAGAPVPRTGRAVAAGWVGAVVAATTLSKRAVSHTKSGVITVHEAFVPVQPPDQPPKTEPAAGTADKVTAEESGKSAEHTVPQLMPTGLLETRPLPVPDFSMAMDPGFRRRISACAVRSCPLGTVRKSSWIGVNSSPPPLCTQTQLFSSAVTV